MSDPKTSLRLMMALHDGTEGLARYGAATEWPPGRGPATDAEIDAATFELLRGGVVVDHYTITGDEFRRLQGGAQTALLTVQRAVEVGQQLAEAVDLLTKSAPDPRPVPALMPLFLVRIDDDPERTLLMAWHGASASNVAAAAEDRFDMPVTEVKYIGAVDTALDVEIAALAPHPAAVVSKTLQQVTAQLVQTLELIRHATAPEPGDGGHHEAAHDLAVGGLQRHAEATTAKGSAA